MTKITWHGHNCWQIDVGKLRVWIDPFLTGNPVATVRAEGVQADFILVSHGHADHLGDCAAIAQRTGAVVLAPFEVANWLQGQGVDTEKLIGMNPGGAIQQPFGRLKMTLAHHSSSLPDGSYGGAPCGLLLELGGKRVYFACDTALFLDMKLIGAGGLDLAVLPIGDLYTMGPDDSLEAARLLGARRVAPCHYDTWPPIAQDPQAWAARVRQHTPSEPIVLQVGGVIEL